MLKHLFVPGFVWLLLVFSAWAEPTAPHLPANGHCKVLADPSWTPQEAFVWSRACAGEIADFNSEPGYGGNLDPMQPERLRDNRTLSPAFIRAVLLVKTYRDALTRNGLRIRGALFKEKLDLRNADLTQDLWLDDSLLEKGADFTGLRSTRRLTLDGTDVAGVLDMGEARIDGDLSLHESRLDRLELFAARIGEELDLASSKIARMNLPFVNVGRDLELERAEFGKANLVGATIGGGLYLVHSTLNGGADLTAARIGGPLICDACQSSGLLDLAEIDIGGDLFVTDGRLAQAFGNGKVHGNVVIIRSKVSGPFIVSGIAVGGILFVGDSDFTDVNLGGAHIHGGLTVGQSRVSGLLFMQGLQDDASLIMYGSQFAAIGLGGARVQGDLNLQGDKVTGSVASPVIKNMLPDIPEARQLYGSFGGAEAQYPSVNLEGSRVGGNLAFTASKLSGKLDMYRAQVGGDVIMKDHATFADVRLLDAHIGGLLNLRSSRVSGDLDAESIVVAGDVFLDDSGEFLGPVSFRFSGIGEMQLSGGIFHQNLDLGGAQVKSDLVLSTAGGTGARWPGSPTLILTNARVGAVQDARDAWPGKLALIGFTYNRLSGAFGTAGSTMADRPVGWLENWLAKSRYSPQPYEQLASVLRAEGRPDAAREILYAGKQKERTHAGWGQWAWMTALDWTVGYGYHIERILGWVVGFVLMGAVVLRASGEGRKHGMPYGMAYSFDLLLPIIQLRKAHYDIDLSGWARYYFYFHRITGYVLGSILIIGISRLVK